MFHFSKKKSANAFDILLSDFVIRIKHFKSVNFFLSFMISYKVHSSFFTYVFCNML